MDLRMKSERILGSFKGAAQKEEHFRRFLFGHFRQCGVFVAVLILFFFMFLPQISCAQVQTSHKWPDPGNLWIVTLDNTESMRSVKLDRDRLCTAIAAAGIDFGSDQFILVHAGAETGGSGNFANQLLHVCDSGKFNNSDELADAILKNWRSFSHKYTAAYVSVLSYYSVAFGALEMQRLSQSREYADIRVLTITSDALEYDGWNLDQRGLRAAGVLEQTLAVKRSLLDNEGEGGAGTLNRTYADESVIPFIRIYQYQTKQQGSCNRMEEPLVQITRQKDGSICICLNERENQFGTVDACYIEKLKVNFQRYSLDTLWDTQASDTLILPLDCHDAWVNNRFEVQGAVRFVYMDSIYGPHYREIPLDCRMKTRSEVFVVRVKWVLRGVAALLALYLLLRLVILPCQKLYVIYAGKRKYVVRRGFARQWRQKRPLMVCKVDAADGHVRGIKNIDRWRVRKGFKTGACCGERTEHSRMPIKQSILFVSRRPLQMQEIEGIGTLKPVRQIEEMEKLEGVYMESMSSKSDIDRRYEAAQLHYPAWVDWKYGKTLAGRLRRSRFSLLQHIGNLLAHISNEHYTVVMVGKGETDRLVIVSPRAKRVGFIEFELTSKEKR